MRHAMIERGVAITAASTPSQIYYDPLTAHILYSLSIANMIQIIGGIYVLFLLIQTPTTKWIFNKLACLAKKVFR